MSRLPKSCVPSLTIIPKIQNIALLILSLSSLLIMSLLLALTLMLTSGAAGATGPDDHARNAGVFRHQKADGRYARGLTGEAVTLHKSMADTVYLLGGDTDPNLGDFEDAHGHPSFDGWTSVDRTANTDTLWNCSDYNCAGLDPGTVPNHAWWCGQYFDDDCGTGDFGGYGNEWYAQLDWQGNVANNALGTTVRLQAMLNYDNETDYDYLYLLCETTAGMQELAVYNGTATAVPVDVSFDLLPGDYVGDASDEVHLRWLFTSDGAWSDEDCLFTSLGAAQIDLITVTFDQGAGPVQQGLVEDCDENPPQWQVELRGGVGDFAHIWPRLHDLDPCRENTTPVLAFIDDGGVVPGTGGYPCITWCYGPGGYIVNPEGGLLGPDFHIHNEVWSPVLAWPGEQYDGAIFAFDVYRHEPLTASSPGMFYIWHVNSSADPDAEEWPTWQDRNFVYYGGPDWLRHENIVTDLMVPGRLWVQVAVGVLELGYVWGWYQVDGTPAPYFDNVAFKVFEFAGPAISSREIDFFQDSFPAIGTIDYADPSANSVRLDMATNIAPGVDLRNDPGDSIVCDVVPVRTGSVLAGDPRLHYKLAANPLFDSYRSSGLPNTGFVVGDTVYLATGVPAPDRFSFDLPDSGFFFPGDRLHYFLEAQDDQGGSIGTTLLPADTTGFSTFPGQSGWVTARYPSSFCVQALPTMMSMVEGDQPRALFWNDFANRGGEDEWFYALANNGYLEGVDYDLYYTNGPSSGVGNGLGGRATATQLLGYDTVLYSGGDLGLHTISNGDFSDDAGDDVGVLDSWLRSGGKNLFLTGDDLVFDLTQNGGAATLAFVNNWLGVNFIARDVGSLIGGQTAPLVQPVVGNSVFNVIQEWIAYGSCPRPARFDAVIPQAGTEMLAGFLDPAGNAGEYPYAAATLAVDLDYDARVVTLPYDLMAVSTPSGGVPYGISIAARTLLLEEVLLLFGHLGTSIAVPVPEAGRFTVQNHPNPFNPATRISYELPRRGHLILKVFSLRGELVKVLLDEFRPAGPGQVIWDGTDASGREVASGIYFCEVQAAGQTRIQKMALVK